MTAEHDEIVRLLHRVIDKIDDVQKTINTGFAYTLRLQSQTLNQGADMAADLSRLTNEVTENTDAAQSAIVLLNNLSQLVRDNAADQDALNALADDLDANAQALADAVVANTPATP